MNSYIVIKETLWAVVRITEAMLKDEAALIRADSIAEHVARVRAKTTGEVLSITPVLSRKQVVRDTDGEWVDAFIYGEPEALFYTFRCEIKKPDESNMSAPPCGN